MANEGWGRRLRDVMKPKIEQLEKQEAIGARQAISDAIDAYNDSRTGLGQPARPLALVIRDPGSEQIVGGLWGISYYSWLFVELLVLPAELRGNGLGTDLMRQAEAVARERGCIGLWLDTFSFQARGFYEKLGYKVFGAIDDYPPGQGRFWLKKRLDEEPTAA